MKHFATFIHTNMAWQRRDVAHTRALHKSHHACMMCMLLLGLDDTETVRKILKSTTNSSR